VHHNYVHFGLLVYLFTCLLSFLKCEKCAGIFRVIKVCYQLQCHLTMELTNNQVLETFRYLNLSKDFLKSIQIILHHHGIILIEPCHDIEQENRDKDIKRLKSAFTRLIGKGRKKIKHPKRDKDPINLGENPFFSSKLYPHIPFKTTGDEGIKAYSVFNHSFILVYREFQNAG
jgi:hypothetical protein